MPFPSRNQQDLDDKASVMVLILTLALFLGASSQSSAETTTPPAAPQNAPSTPPVRSVSLIAPSLETWSEQIEAHGNVMPWQETRIGTEIGGLRVVSVLVNAGDLVKKGQVLARLNPTTVEIDLETANAQLMEAQGAQAQALATLERAKRLAPSGGVSQQDLMLYETQKQTAEARLNAARAQVKTQQLRLDSATLVAPDDGIISSRSVTEGAIVQAGSELFRLIRQGRLEWRAEVKGEMLIKLAVGQEVTIKSPLGPEVKGRVRQISPTIDLTTRNGLLYVDLPPDTDFKAGLYVSGTLAMNKQKVLVLPASAVRRNGNRYQVFQVTPESIVKVVEVEIGRSRDDQMEITGGLDERARVIGKDIESLKAGDAVNLGSDG
jgi:HlyD family secretion protein